MGNKNNKTIKLSRLKKKNYAKQRCSKMVRNKNGSFLQINSTEDQQPCDDTSSNSQICFITLEPVDFLQLQPSTTDYPANRKIKEKWISATGRPDSWFPTKTSTVCSEHFKNTDFQETNKSRRLFPWAVPTVKIRLVYKEDTTSQPQPSTNSELKSENPSTASDVQDIAVAQANNEESLLKRRLKVIEKKNNMIRHQKLKIKALQTALRRYKKKVKDMKEQIEKLQQNSSDSE